MTDRVWWVEIPGDIVAIRAESREAAVELVRESGVQHIGTVVAAPPGFDDATNELRTMTPRRPGQQHLGF